MSRAGPAMTPAYTGNINYHPATFHPAALLRCRQQAGECRRSAIELRAIAKASSAHKEASCEVAAAANAAVLALEQAIDAVEAAGPTDFESSTQHILRLDRLAAELAAVIDLAEIRILVRLPQLLYLPHAHGGRFVTGPILSGKCSRCAVHRAVARRRRRSGDGEHLCEYGRGRLQ